MSWGPIDLTRCRPWTSCEKEGCEDLTGQPTAAASVNQDARPAYVYGEAETHVCPSGSVIIEQEVGCTAAADNLKLSYNGTVSSELIPKGCVLSWPYETSGDEFKGSAMLNTGSGGIGEKARPICKFSIGPADLQIFNRPGPSGNQPDRSGNVSSH